MGGQSFRTSGLLPYFPAPISEHPNDSIVKNTCLDGCFLRLLSWSYNLMTSERFSSVITFKVFKLLHAYCSTCKLHNSNTELIFMCNISKSLTGDKSFDHHIFAFFSIICIIITIFRFYSNLMFICTYY